MTITSLQDWAATCNGNQTRGPWSPSEQSLHINCLELLVQLPRPSPRRSPILLQLNSSCLHKQEGDSIIKVVSANKGPVIIVHGEEHSPSGSALTGSSEHNGRQGVQNLVRQVGMEAVSYPIPRNQSLSGTFVHGPFWYSDQQFGGEWDTRLVLSKLVLPEPASELLGSVQEIGPTVHLSPLTKGYAQGDSTSLCSRDRVLQE